MSERRTNFGKRAEFENLRLNLLRRLSVICLNMSEAELNLLAAKMTRLRLKYDTTTALP